QRTECGAAGNRAADQPVEPDVDVLDDPAQQRTPAGGEAAGYLREKVGHHLGAPVCELTERGVVRGETLEIAPQRPGDGEGADAHDGDREREDRRLSLGPDDEPGRRRRQPDPGQRGQRPGHTGENEPGARRQGRPAATHAVPQPWLLGPATGWLGLPGAGTARL